jgi:signal transduction histidine kinase
MTGPAPRYHTRWDDPGHEAEGQSVSVFTGRFEDSRLEAAFRRQVWPEWSARLRVVNIAAAVLFAVFGYTDWLALGWSPALFVCAFMRALVLAGAVVIARMTLAAPRIVRLDQAMFVQMSVFSVALFAVVGLQHNGLMFEAPGAVLMILSFYLFVPVRFEIQLASAVFVSAGFLIVGGMMLDATALELFTAGVEIAICNVLGAFTALRTHVLHRREYAGLRQLQRRLRFEELVARLSTRFITAPSGALAPRIAEALAEIGQFTGADRCWVFEFDPTARVSSCSHEWSRPEVTPVRLAFQRMPYEEYSWAMSELMAGRNIVAHRMADLPPEADAERATAEQHGARSMLVLPLMFGERVLGAIGFHAVRREMHWDSDRIAALRMVGEMVIGVMEHHRAGDELATQTRRLEQSVSALASSNSALEHFAYVASHDLQEPLRSIASFSSLLAMRYRGRLDAKADEYIDYLRRAAARMHDLITGLLGYSRLDTHARRFERCQSSEVIEAALENLRAALDEAGAHVRVAATPVLEGDRTQLVQLFQNVIGNAVKFRANEKPQVLIDARRGGDFWEFSIADNGIGIDPRHAERVFQPFTRLQTPDRYPGTGIGLAICRRIVERHRGRIWVEPNPPQGSVVRFRLPAAA